MGEWISSICTTGPGVEDLLQHPEIDEDTRKTVFVGTFPDGDFNRIAFPCLWVAHGADQHPVDDIKICQFFDVFLVGNLWMFHQRVWVLEVLVLQQSDLLFQIYLILEGLGFQVFVELLAILNLILYEFDLFIWVWDL